MSYTASRAQSSCLEQIIASLLDNRSVHSPACLVWSSGSVCVCVPLERFNRLQSPTVCINTVLQTASLSPYQTDSTQHGRSGAPYPVWLSVLSNGHYTHKWFAYCWKESSALFWEKKKSTVCLEPTPLHRQSASAPLQRRDFQNGSHQFEFEYWIKKNF